jgi:hypothetical protein
MFNLTIDTDNATFQDGNATAEIARILRDIADKLERGLLSGHTIDMNGNHVGTYGAHSLIHDNL